MERQETRKIVKFFGWFFIGLTLLTGLIWFNNLVVTLQWNPRAGQDVKPQGPFPWFDRLAMDYSTVTTLVPFFGCLLIASGFFRIAKAKSNSNISEYFPFSKNYIPITVALGLIGTVWGLIMIGYYDPKEIEMPQLIKCLHTALFSTFIALLWVFLFVYPVRYIMQRAYWSIAGYKKLPGAENILSLLNHLGASVSQTTDSLDKTGNGLLGFNQQLSGTKGELGEFNEVLNKTNEQAEEILNKAKSTIEQVHLESRVWRKAAEEQVKSAKANQAVAEEHLKVLQQLRDELDKTKQQKNEAEKRAMKAEVERDDSKTKLAEARIYLKRLLGIKSK